MKFSSRKCFFGLAHGSNTNFGPLRKETNRTRGTEFSQTFWFQIGFEVQQIGIKMDFLFRNPLAVISLIHQLCQLEIVYCWLSFIKMEHWLIKS